MADRELTKTAKQERRKRRVRKKVVGTPTRPRLCVFRSLRNVYAQIIDDDSGTTLVSCSSIDKDMLEQAKTAKKKSDLSLLIGVGVAKKALEKGIEAVVFDRNRYQYHGRVKLIAEGARKAGLKL
jgi:large subunit ribosomal protein L18